MHRTPTGHPILLGLLGAGLLLAGCESPLRPDPPDVWIHTDRDAYRLTFDPGIYRLELTARYTNRSSGTVWLHRACGFGDHPSRSPVRADGSDTPIWLTSGVCTTRPLRAPIPVGAGETYVDHVMLVSSVSPNAQPPITMAMRTGTFRLVYAIQSSDSVAGWHPVDLVPEDERVSNTFEVLPP